MFSQPKNKHGVLDTNSGEVNKRSSRNPGSGTSVTAINKNPRVGGKRSAIRSSNPSLEALSEETESGESTASKKAKR